ncbi:MAG: SMP-30/gluconolactonase/LRE family protein [Desulfobacteraceae bacterium]|nr:MAG: SMP-30/gluconolactonase/LRE family protein [Desulfobacteraceae bacterium]
MKKFIMILVVVAAILGYFLFWPARIEPISYEPAKKPEMTGALAPNNELAKAELLAKGKISGPEDVVIDSEGRIYGGTQDGKIVRILKDGRVETFAETGGRPMGLAFDSKGNLIVADAYKGLLSVDAAGTITVLTTGAEGVPFKFTDHLDIASDGTIYFTDASFKYRLNEYLFDLLESKPNGRFLRYDPDSKITDVLLRNLYFSNGVALSQNEDFVLVNETYRYRIQRYWLKGPKAGTADIFLDNLPGFPDNVTSNRKGNFWVALFTVRNNQMDSMHPSPFIKKIISRLPKFLWPKPKPYGFVLAVNEDGKIINSLQEPTGEHLKEITGAREHDGYLYLGSLHNDRIGKYKLE